MVELPVLKRSDATSATNVELAERGGFFYLTGGDPGRHVPRVAVAPHFETFGQGWVDSVLVDPTAEDVVIVGIDERSAALWDGRAWTARGPGRITVVTRRDRGVYQSGAPACTAPRARPAG